MLYLPKTTPNYMLYLETDYESMYISTLKLHFDYVQKVLQMNTNRLPNILANYIIANNIFWAKEWSNLLQQVHSEVSANFQNFESTILLEKLKEREREDNIEKAHSSQYHDLYPKLDFSVAPRMLENFGSWPTSLIIKARGGMLNINARSFQTNTTGLCTICNMEASENSLHFIGVCPIFKPFRIQYLGSDYLAEEDVIRILNGTLNYYSLYKYLESALNYRNMILNEFN